MKNSYVAGVLFSLILIAATPITAQRFDILVQNGKIVDGTGNPWFYGDVGIKKGRIVAIGNLSGKKSKSVIDAAGKMVTPGFIDVHTHIEGGILERPLALNYLYDGVTTAVTGNCGSSDADLKPFFEDLKKIGTAINVASLIGHNGVRREVMGSDDRQATPEELLKMQLLIDKAMKDGAVGLSTGLIYVPGTYAETDEIVALAKVAAKHGGVYATHMRHEDHKVFEAIAEATHIGTAANIPVQISHFKISGKTSWGASKAMVDTILACRARGIDVAVDQYPYTASSTSLDVLLPSWALAGGRDSLKARLQRPELKERIIEDMGKSLDETGFKDYSYAVIARYPPKPDYNGKNISEVNVMAGRKGTVAEEKETILELVLFGRVQMIYHKMHEDDVRYIMQSPYTLVASDGGIPEFGNGSPHPRSYGTNSRVLARYVREQGLITLEDAIRKMTSAPALRFNLKGRGLILQGMAADVVIFDADTFEDKATFDKPHAYSTGISHVIVNGKIVLADGKHTGVKSGTVLRRGK